MDTIKNLRAAANMTQKAFAEYFGIPKRTIENWEASDEVQAKRGCPEYLLPLLRYKLEKEGIIPGGVDPDKTDDTMTKLETALMEKLPGLAKGESYEAYNRCLAMIRQIREYRHGVELLAEEITTL